MSYPNATTHLKETQTSSTEKSIKFCELVTVNPLVALAKGYTGCLQKWPSTEEKKSRKCWDSSHPRRAINVRTISWLCLWHPWASSIATVHQVRVGKGVTLKRGRVGLHPQRCVPNGQSPLRVMKRLHSIPSQLTHLSPLMKVPWVTQPKKNGPSSFFDKPEHS